MSLCDCCKHTVEFGECGLFHGCLWGESCGGGGLCFIERVIKAAGYFGQELSDRRRHDWKHGSAKKEVADGAEFVRFEFHNVQTIQVNQHHATKKNRKFTR